MSLVSKTKILRDALKNVEGLKCYHIRKPASVTAPYCVWQEETEGQSHYSDNIKSEQVVELTVDYFTKTEYDSMIDSIQNAMNAAQISWQLESFQYEDETKLLHYEWLVKVV